MREPQQRGFTLIEVMIAVAVVGILVSLAYPSFVAEIRKSRRAEAQQVLMDVASRQQQRRLDTRSFVTGASVTATGATVPASVSSHYTIRFEPAATVDAFIAEAVPTGSQASDRCGTLRVNQNNEKSSTGTAVNCW